MTLENALEIVLGKRPIEQVAKNYISNQTGRRTRLTWTGSEVTELFSVYSYKNTIF